MSPPRTQMRKGMRPPRLQRQQFGLPHLAASGLEPLALPQTRESTAAAGSRTPPTGPPPGLCGHFGPVSWIWTSVPAGKPPRLHSHEACKQTAGQTGPFFPPSGPHSEAARVGRPTLLCLPASGLDNLSTAAKPRSISSSKPPTKREKRSGVRRHNGTCRTCVMTPAEPNTRKPHHANTNQ